MKLLNFILSIYTVLLLTSCNFEEGGEDSGGGLFSNHQELENTFLLIPKSARSYLEGENIDISIQHTANITVTGTPRVELDIGGSSVYANYLAGNGTSNLTFRYTVVDGDNDSDGIDITPSIDLNGGTLKFNSSSGVEDATTDIVVVDFSNQKVDTLEPELSFVTPPNPKTYLYGEVLNFIAVFNDTVFVTGTPTLNLDIGGSTVSAVYTGGHNSTTLFFSYTVSNSDLDTDGITMSSPLLLNAGTIKDRNGLDAVITYTPTPMPSTYVNGAIPIVTNLTPPNDNTYLNTEALTITLEFSKDVNVTGAPRIESSIGTNSRYFYYTSGSGTDELVFQYNAQEGDDDLNGITLATSIDLNGGTIQDSTTTNADLDLSPPLLPNVKIDAGIASVLSIDLPSNTTYIQGDELFFTLNFDRNVDITGTPQLPITLTSGVQNAVYISGTGTDAITFRYQIQNGDLDLDGPTIGNTLDINGGSIIAQNGVDASDDLTSVVGGLDTSGIIINAAAPSITAITPPADNNYTTGSDIDFTVTFSKVVDITGSPRISLDVGGSALFATYQSGTGTTDLVFRYTVSAPDDDQDGIEISNNLIALNGGTIRDSSSVDADLDMTAYLPTLTNVLVNENTITITSITPPSDNTYNYNNNLVFTVNTSENIDVTGTPQIAIDIGGTTKYATYQSGTGSTALVFQYTVELNLQDLDGIEITSPLDLNGGTLKNSALEDLDLTFTPPTMSSVLVDSIAPIITSVTPPSDNTYIDSDTLSFTVNTDEAIDVTGTPQIAIDIGGTTKYATYQSGTGTTALVFEYTVETGLNDSDGITISSPLEENSGTLQNSSLKDLILDFTSPDLSNVLIDSTPPLVAITSPLDNSYINSSTDSATFTISGTCNENSKTVTIEVDGGASASPVNFLCDGTNFTGTIDTTSLSEAAHTFVAKITDDALNEGSSSVVNITKDITAPTITSVAPSSNGWYKEAENIDFLVNFDESVEQSGTPQISLDLNSTTVYATYESGATTSALNFRYVVQGGDEDTDGLSFISSTIDLNGGNLSDAAGNQINLNLDATIALPNISGVLIDAILPTVTITSAPNITAANELNYTISGACSENGQTVNIDIDSLSYSPTCSSNAWSVGPVDVSARPDNPAFPITADHSDIAGNLATQASVTIDKDSVTPTVTITSAVDINASNVTSYSVSGTCTENGSIVDIYIDALNFQPNCSGGTWSTGYIDVSTISDDPAVAITADHSTATQASTTVVKDTLSSTVTISLAANISLSNQTNYTASGTCSDNGVMVDIYIDSLNYQPTCSSGSWSTGVVDVSTLADGSITITADHSTATQASKNITKNTATPTVASLSAPTTLTTSIDLTWNLNDPGGFTIDDYEINYRQKNTSTWLPFNDGVSTDTEATVTSLIASTTYEFRVRVQYNTSNYSDWSSIAEGTTKPDDPLFNSPYAAMNVGGSTSTSVVAYYDNTTVTLNGTPIPDSPLSKGQTSIIATSQFDVIDADAPIYTAGLLGSGNGGSGANMVWMPTSWAGKTFSFNATRANPQNLFVFATENATVEVKQGSTVLASTTITAGSGATLNWSVYGSYQVVSTGTILAYHMSGSGTTRYDPKPILPGYSEIIGFPSASMRLTADLDGTNYNSTHSNSTVATGNLNKSDVIQINPQGTSSLYQSESLLIAADRNISGASFADSNGLCAAPFLPTNLMKKRYIINANANYVAFASKAAGTISVYSPAQTIGVDTPVATLNLTRSGANSSAPFKARFGTYSAGYRFVSTVPMAGWYHPNVEAGSAANDETILYGTNE